MKALKIALGKRIRKLRKAKGLTQEKLGFISGVSYKFIGEIERGEVNPSLETLNKIAVGLNVKMNELFPAENDISRDFTPKESELIKKTIKILIKHFK